MNGTMRFLASLIAALAIVFATSVSAATDKTWVGTVRSDQRDGDHRF